MSHFYGTLQGARGEATRCGTKSSGLIVKAASWQGAVSVTLTEINGVDYATVDLIHWHGAGTTKRLYNGPISGPLPDPMPPQGSSLGDIEQGKRIARRLKRK